jgi:CheY-like chemotaxis protein
MQSPHLILLVDSRTDDLYLMQRAFRAVGVHNPIRALHELDECRDYLRGRGIYGDRKAYPLPSILVLDLMYSLGCAFDLLAEVRTMPGLENIPIIVFVPNEHGTMVQRAYDLGANAAFTKGIELQSLAKTIRELEFLEDLLRMKAERSGNESAA